jgi:SAM-dependent methyltransferase
MAAGRADIARCLLRCLVRDDDSGIQERDVEAFTGNPWTGVISTAKTKAKAIARKAVPPVLRPFAGRALRSVRHSQAFAGTTDSLSSIDRAVREIENIRLVHPRRTSSDRNAADFPDFVSTNGWTRKRRSVAQILSAKKPGSALDIGSNLGWYSQLAARNGAQVVSVDLDEAAVTELFFAAVATQLPILPLVADFRSMNPVMAWATAPGQAYVDRLRCDMVLALGLVHHLAFERRLTFDLIVRGLSAFARQCLVVEFVGREAKYVRERLNDRFCWYTLDKFSTALRHEFRELTEFPSDQEDSWVLLCEK